MLKKTLIFFIMTAITSCTTVNYNYRGKVCTELKPENGTPGVIYLKCPNPVNVNGVRG